VCCAWAYFFALYYFVQILRFLTFNFFSVRSIFFRANRWSVLSSADLTMNCELELEFESSHIVACVQGGRAARPGCRCIPRIQRSRGSSAATQTRLKMCHSFQSATVGRCRRLTSHRRRRRDETVLSGRVGSGRCESCITGAAARRVVRYVMRARAGGLRMHPADWIATGAPPLRFHRP